MKCGISGHFAKYCKIRSPKKAETHEVKANEIQKESSSDEESFLLKIGNNNRPVYPICVEDAIINMLIDSRSTLNIIDETTYWKLRTMPKLQNSTDKIFTYSGQTPVKLQALSMQQLKHSKEKPRQRFMSQRDQMVQY